MSNSAPKSSEIPAQTRTPLTSQVREWNESLRRIFEDPTPGNIRAACFVSQQTWLTFFSAAAPFGTPPAHLQEMGKALLQDFRAVIDMIDGLPASQARAVSSYRHKFSQRAEFIDTLFEKGAEAVVPLLDASIEGDLAVA